MNNTKEFLNHIGINDVSSDYKSDKRFADGGQFRFEVPGIQSPKTMAALLKEAEKQDLVIHRVTQTKGIMFLTDEEISEMVERTRTLKCFTVSAKTGEGIEEMFREIAHDVLTGKKNKSY